MPSSSNDPYIGATIGKVKLNKKLGQGGMGMVYRGHHQRLDRTVAVKLLQRQTGEKGDMLLERFIREGQAAAAIEHPNVVQVLDAGRTDLFAYLILEYVDGNSLGGILRRKEKLSADMVEALGIGVAEGLAAIHERNIIHRDIKPDNILLSRNGMVKITDLGLARQVDEGDLNRLTASGVVIGTPFYVSPEAIDNSKTAGAASDIYSFGATIYHLLAGRPPHDSHTPYEVLRMHMTANPIPLIQIRSDIPRSLNDLVMCCMNRDPKQRPTAAQVSAALRGRMQVRQHRPSAIAILSLAVVLFLSLTAAGVYWYTQRQPNDVPTSGPAIELMSLHPKAEHSYFDPSSEQWRAWPPQGLNLGSGDHQLRLRSQRDGAWFYWNGDVSIPAPGSADSEPIIRLDPPFLPMTVPPVTINMPPESRGMIIINGRSYGDDNQVRLEQAGHYQLVRWDIISNQAWFREVRISDAGSLLDDEWEQDRQAPKAFLLAHWHQQQAVPPHLLVSWGIAEQARSQQQLPTPAGWSVGSLAPHRLANKLTSQLVHACASAHPELQLPDIRQRDQLFDAYQTALWFEQSDGSLSVYPRGQQRQAVLILTDANPQQTFASAR